MKRNLPLIFISFLLLNSLVIQAQKLQWQAEKHFQRNIPTLKQYDFSLSYSEKSAEEYLNLTTITLPDPTGKAISFKLSSLQVMSDALAKKYPMIQSYLGHGDNGEVSRITLTPKGLHAMVFSKNGLYYTDPISLNSPTKYQSYYKRDLDNRSEKANFIELEPLMLDQLQKNTHKNSSANSQRIIPPTGATLRTYRIAIAATGEYTKFHGGTVTDALAAIVTTLTRVNGIYERELAIRMILVDNNDALIFTDGTNDPFTNDDSDSYINEVQTFLDNTVGSNNYDIGHGFSTGAGGLAAQGVCVNGRKGSGVTGTKAPIGDPYDVDYVAHEIGHQFGAPHTFNGSQNSCAGGNRNASTAYEPGSGVTIMAYAGICGSDNIANNSIPFFHASSLQTISTYSQESAGNSCAVSTETGNSVPEVEAGTGGFVIPISTPFQLNGSAFDNDGDDLTYSWEQFDLGPAGAPNSPVGNAPLFRSFTPSPDSFRIFPKISDILDGTQTIGEILPDYARDLSFILTVRDNQAIGGVNNDLISFSVSDNGGPFTVSEIIGDFTGFDEITINWNVANTNLSPINCSEVDIYLSDNGGLTFNHLVAKNTANDGTEKISLPNIEASNVRVKVAASQNIFFNIAPGKFSIKQTTDPTFTLNTSFDKASYCPSDNLIITVNSEAILNFSEPIALSISNLNNSLNASFNPQIINPGESGTLTISNPNNISGAFNFDIIGTATSVSRSLTNNVIISNIPQTPQILSPTPNDFTGLFPMIEWSDDNLLSTYKLELATDENFQNIIESVNNITDKSYQIKTQLSGSTDYFLRLNASNNCGVSPNAEFAFRTDEIVCVAYEAENVPLTISTDISTLSAELEILDMGQIQSVEVMNIKGTHSYVSDLTFILESPNGTQVTLISDVCGSENDFNFSFSNLSGISQAEIDCPPISGGTYLPNESLNKLNGEQIKGVWKLLVVDAFQEDGGSLDGWGLSFCLTNAEVAPRAPVGLVANYLNGLAIELIWGDVETETAYEVERKATLNASFVPMATLEANDTSLITELQDVNREYIYRVRSVKDGLFSKYSAEVSASIDILSNTELNASKIRLYPNPVSKTLYINNPTKNAIDKILIYRSNGQLVLSKTENLGQIDMSSFKTGLYLVRIIAGVDQVSKRVIVK